MINTKKIFLSALFLLASPVFAGQQYMSVQCATHDKSGYFYSDPNTGKKTQAASCGEALAKVPADYKLESHDSLSGFDGPAYMSYGVVMYLFKQG